MRRTWSVVTATTWWRVLQAVGVSVLIAAGAVMLGVPIADPCDICAQTHPWWMCLLIGCF